MLHKLATAIGTILTVLFLAWAVVNAGVGMKAPDIASQTWLNSAPLHLSDLKGKVVIVEFWTFGCYNCRNVEPYVKEWHRKYSPQGFVVIGVHTPEFSHERAPLSPYAWIFWSYDWAVPAPGRHTLIVRATDGFGSLQTSIEQEPAPDGASGLHEITVTVAA